MSALSGWLATKFLCSPVPLTDAVHNSNCVCQAAITGVDSTACCVRKEHVTCGSEITSCTAQPVTCQACDVSHLTEIPNKPSLQVCEKSLLCPILCGNTKKEIGALIEMFKITP